MARVTVASFPGPSLGPGNEATVTVTHLRMGLLHYQCASPFTLLPVPLPTYLAIASFPGRRQGPGNEATTYPDVYEFTGFLYSVTTITYLVPRVDVPRVDVYCLL